MHSPCLELFFAFITPVALARCHSTLVARIAAPCAECGFNMHVCVVRLCVAQMCLHFHSREVLLVLVHACARLCICCSCLLVHARARAVCDRTCMRTGVLVQQRKIAQFKSTQRTSMRTSSDEKSNATHDQATFARACCCALRSLSRVHKHKKREDKHEEPRHRAFLLQ